MTIRNAFKSDLEKLANLFDGYRVFYRKQSDLQGALTFLNERLQNKDSEIFVAANDSNELMGFVQLYPIFSSTKMQRLWLLNDLFVSEKYRSLSVSIKLIEASKELCRATGACGLNLETEKSNQIGNQLYPKTGFVLDSENNYYHWANK